MIDPFVARYEHLNSLGLEPVNPLKLPDYVVKDFPNNRDQVEAAQLSSQWLDAFVVEDEVATTFITHSLAGDEQVEERIYALDFRGTTPLGYGYIRMLQNPVLREMRDMPFISFTTTFPAALGERLGLRRLFVLNQVSKTVLESVVYSGQYFSHPAARRHWDRLEDAGYAEGVEVGSQARRRFTS